MKSIKDDDRALFGWVLDNLREAAATSDGGFSHLVLATNGLDGAPAARTVVLRSVEDDLRALTVFTDKRTRKVTELQRSPKASALFYDPATLVQVRLTGDAHVMSGGPDVEEAWSTTALPSRKSYMTVEAPGTTLPSPASGLPDGLDGRVPSEAESEAGRTHFSIIRLEPSWIEVVVLGRDGNRGLTAARQADGMWGFEWRVP